MINLSNFFTFVIVYLYQMQSAKIQLSADHIALVTNAEWILTKNEILLHIKKVLEGLYSWQQPVLQASLLPAAVLKTGGKISRGENYLGLPWLVLDHPRCFAKSNFFAIRTLFWWGKYLSVTLHLSGKWQQAYAPSLTASFHQLQEKGFLLCCSGDEWIHDIGNAAYQPLKHSDVESFAAALQKAPFLKLAAYVDIREIEDAMPTLQDHFAFLVGILGSGQA
ncbi:hypothetical protein ABDK00_016140 [Niabella insulamsoli]|uniref:hypothetical protein n=1 Tax=Niabella insulamsoli TaxID=3144874 RepID=UPI0031FC25CA